VTSAHCSRIQNDAEFGPRGHSELRSTKDPLTSNNKSPIFTITLFTVILFLIAKDVGMETNNPIYASLGSRFLALSVDALLLSAVFFPTTRIVKGVWIMTPSDHLWRVGWLVSDPLCMIFLLVIFIYFVVLKRFD
jgi:hypothetical protein